jgi:RTX calcium-binding nonapeptide repeat (4 copies)
MQKVVGSNPISRFARYFPGEVAGGQVSPVYSLGYCLARRPARWLSAMTMRLITALAAVMAFAAATAYATVTTIPPSEYPPGCQPNGKALQGDQGADVRHGTSRRDLLRGGPGRDGLRGLEKADCLFGQAGQDFVAGGPGDDRVIGGDDLDNLRGEEGDDLLRGGRGREDFMDGGPDEDSLFGGSGTDWIWGGGGDDRVWGGRGNDRIVDAHGDNEISCGRGYDRVRTDAASQVGDDCENVWRPAIPVHECGGPPSERYGGTFDVRGLRPNRRYVFVSNPVAAGVGPPYFTTKFTTDDAGARMGVATASFTRPFRLDVYVVTARQRWIDVERYYTFDRPCQALEAAGLRE